MDPHSSPDDLLLRALLVEEHDGMRRLLAELLAAGYPTAPGIGRDAHTDLDVDAVIDLLDSNAGDGDGDIVDLAAALDLDAPTPLAART